MAGEEWTDHDLAALSDFDLRGMSPAAIAERMDRSARGRRGSSHDRPATQWMSRLASRCGCWWR